MEIVEMFCDLLLARFGLLTQMKELDAGIAEQVSSLIWVAPRLQSDVQELKGESYTLLIYRTESFLFNKTLFVCYNFSYFGPANNKVWKAIC